VGAGRPHSQTAAPVLLARRELLVSQRAPAVVAVDAPVGGWHDARRRLPFVGPRTYSLYYAGEQIRTIAWHEHGATYWIQNTLTNTVQPREMLAIAEQTQPVVSPRASASLAGTGASIPTPQAVKLPPREAAPLSLAAKLGALLGFVGLAVVALLALLVLYRRRELIGLREQVASALALEASRRAQLLERGPQR
jgi:hypothetical protein